MTCWQGSQRKGVPFASSQVKMGKEIPGASSSTIIPGKLADETMLGGINKLMIPQYIQRPMNSVPLKKRYRQGCFNLQFQGIKNVVQNSTSSKTDNDTTNETQDQELIASGTVILKTDLENNNYNKDEEKAESPPSETMPDELKKDRACKGKRYRKFMAQTLSSVKAKEMQKKKSTNIQKSSYHLRNQRGLTKLHYAGKAKIKKPKKNTNPIQKDKVQEDEGGEKSLPNHLSLLAEAALTNEGLY